MVEPLTVSAAAARTDRSRGLRRIEAFVAEYHVDDGRRRPAPAELSLIKAALVDYLLAEEWIVGPAATQSASGSRALDRLHRLDLPPSGRTLIKLVERDIQDLATRLSRREEANLIMREHLIMLTEAGLRRAAATIEPLPPPTMET